MGVILCQGAQVGPEPAAVGEHFPFPFCLKCDRSDSFREPSGSDVLPWVLIRTGALASFSLGSCPPPLPAWVSGPSSSCLPPAAGDEARQLVGGGALLPRTLSMGIHPWNEELVPWPQAAMWH